MGNSALPVPELVELHPRLPAGVMLDKLFWLLE